MIVAARSLFITPPPRPLLSDRRGCKKRGARYDKPRQHHRIIITTFAVVGCLVLISRPGVGWLTLVVLCPVPHTQQSPKVNLRTLSPGFSRPCGSGVSPPACRAVMPHAEARRELPQDQYATLKGDSRGGGHSIGHPWLVANTIGYSPTGLRSSRSLIGFPSLSTSTDTSFDACHDCDGAHCAAAVTALIFAQICAVAVRDKFFNSSCV